MKRSALYYASHPEAAAKKRKYQAQREKSPEQVRYRVERKRERRRRGIYGKGGPDMSHTESGKMVPEDPSTNRARNGHGGKPRFKADSGCSLAPQFIRADKKCGESGIAPNKKCSKKTEAAQGVNKGRVAGAVLGGAAVAYGLLVAKDARSYFKGSPDLPPTGSFRNELRKAVGRRNPGQTRDPFAERWLYDDLAKDWKVGDLVYYRHPKKDLQAHYGVYAGKSGNVHMIANAGLVNDEQGKLLGHIGVQYYGNVPKDPRFVGKPVVWKKVPDKLQPPKKYSQTEIEDRIEAMLGEPYDFDLIENNCETWARMIVSGTPRSVQIERFSRINREIAKIINRDSKGTHSEGKPKTAKQMQQELAKRRGDSADLTPTIPEGASDIEAYSIVKNHLIRMMKKAYVGKVLKTDSAPLTVALVRADKKCGESAIPDHRKCTKNTKNTRKAAITAGVILGSAVTLGLALKSKKAPTATIPSPGITPRMLRRNPPSAPTPKSVTVPRALPGTPPPYGLLSPAPPRLSKTARMRANTAAAEKLAEQRIAQTAREEVRRIGQIGNTMAATGEAAGMRVKTTVREVRLRLEAARRKFEPGYRSVPQAPKALKASTSKALPQAPLRDRLPEGVEVPPWTPQDEVEFNLAKKRGQKWDEFEKNKDVPRCDALQACTRRVGNPSFFAQYVVGLDGKTGFKSPAPRHRLNLSKDPGRRSGFSKNFTAVSPGVARVFDNEAALHALANSKGVDAPRLLAYNEKTKVLKMEHLGEYISVKSSGDALDYFLDPQLTGKYLNALEKLHRAGIAHTDLHAGNVMMHRTTRNIKIIDFGTAMDARWGVDEVQKYVGNRVANPFRPLSGRDYLYIDIRGATNAVTMSTISNAEMSVILRKTIGMNLPSQKHWLEGSNSDVMDRKIAEYYAEIRKALLNHTKNNTTLASNIRGISIFNDT